VGTWTYSFGGIGGESTALVKDPLSHQSYYTFFKDIVQGEIVLFGGVKSARNAENQTTFYNWQYQHSAGHLLTKVTYPEGNQLWLSHDARGNLTESRQVAKAAGVAPDIVVTASYSTVCGNTLTCNQPTSVMDARGSITDFTYDAAHGRVLTQTLPAPVAGAVRPQVRHGYAQQHAWYFPNGSSTISAAPTPVWLNVMTSQCTSFSACAAP